MCILFSALCFDRHQVFAEVNALPQKNIALQLYSVRHDLQKDYKHTIQQVRETGYTMVEAANYRDGKFYGLTPEDFKKILKK